MTGLVTLGQDDSRRLFPNEVLDLLSQNKTQKDHEGERTKREEARKRGRNGREVPVKTRQKAEAENLDDTLTQQTATQL